MNRKAKSDMRARESSSPVPENEQVARRREKLAAWMPWAKPLMGATLLVVGIAILFHIDRMIEGWVLDQMPVWLQDLSVSV